MNDLLKTFLGLFAEAEVTEPALVEHSSQNSEQQNLEVLVRTLSFADCLPFLTAEKLLDLEVNQFAMAELYQQSGLSEDEFNELFVPLVRSLADFTQLLPASESHHHARLGGLFTHSIEVAAIALRRSKGVSFVGDKEGSERAKDKIRWPVACGIAALLHDAGKAAYDLIVRSGNGHEVWNPFAESLSQFSVKHQGYRVFWRTRRVHKLHEFSGLALSNRLIPHRLMEWLAEGDSAIIPVMLQAICGIGNTEYPALSEVVGLADGESVAKDLTSSRKVVASGTGENEEVATAEPVLPGDEAATHTVWTKKLVSMLPELLAGRKLLVNEQDRTRGVFWSSDDSYIVWPAFFNSINAIFQDEEYKAYPKHSGVFYEAMVTAGLVEKLRSNKAPQYEIRQKDQKVLKLSLARIADMELKALLQRYAEEEVQISRPDSELSEMLEKAVAAGDPDEDKSEQSISPESVQTELSEANEGSPKDGTPADSGDGQVAKTDGESLTPEDSDSDAVADEVVAEKQSEATVSTSDVEGMNSAPAPEGVTNEKNRQDLVSEYIANLGNPAIRKIQSLGEVGELLGEVGSCLCHGRFNENDFGTHKGIFWLAWPRSAKVLGDDPQDVIQILAEGKMLLRQGVEADFKVKPTGQADFAHGAKRFRVIAFSKQASKLILESHGLNSDAMLDESKLAHSPPDQQPPKSEPDQQQQQAEASQPQKTERDEGQSPKPVQSKNRSRKPQAEPDHKPKNSEPDQQQQQAESSQPQKPERDEGQSPKPAQSKNRNRKSQSDPEQQTQKTEQGQPAEPQQNQSPAPDHESADMTSNDSRVSVSEIIHTFDLYISVNLQMYSAQLEIRDSGISVRYPSVIFSDACKSTSLQEHWWAKVRRMDKISVGDNAIHFPNGLLPKTFAALNTYQESNSEG